MIEKLDVAPAWRGPWRRSQRCVMPAAGFYEWPVQPDGTKQPYCIQPAGDDEVFSIAALWERSRTESGEDVLFPKSHALHRVGSSGQGRNRTTDTRIFAND